MDIVEIDEAMVRVAQDQFNFHPTNRLNVITMDGVKFIDNLASSGIFLIQNILSFISNIFVLLYFHGKN